MERRPSHRVTLQDVADVVGVSRSTVSLVLSDHPRISRETRRKVLEAVEALGYVYDRRAASLRTKRSYTVGLIITDITNPFYAELTSGIESQLLEANYIALLGSTSDRIDNQERFIETMRERGTDGIILCPARGTSADSIESLARQLPTVLITRYLAGLDIDYVGTDNELGARRATEHFIERGHRRIAFIGGPQDSSARRDRLSGLLSSLEKHGMALDASLLMTSPVTRKGGYDAIQALAARGDAPTAVLCYNDVVAFGVMLGLRACGLEPGRDVAVAGFDDVHEASLWNPPLSSVSATLTQMGQQAAALLLQRIEEPARPPQQVILPSSLIIRASS